MIDTLRLNLTDCEISSHTPLIIEPSLYSYDNKQEFFDYDLFIDTSGQVVTGKKAFFNSDKFNLTIKPKYFLKTDEIEKKLSLSKFDWNKKEGGINYDIIQDVKINEDQFNAGIFVQTSLPRYNNNSNFNPLTPGEEKKVLNKLENDLSSIGIKCNIWDSNLSRIDTFSNIYTDENFYSYANLFEVLQASRMERFDYSGTTFLYKNGERQICIYDKVKEMLEKISDKNTYGFMPGNVMRIENRYLRKRKIHTALQFYSLKDMFKNYDYLKENHLREIETNIFKYDLQEVEIMTGNLIKERMLRFYNQGKRYWIRNYFVWWGMVSLLKCSNIETITEKINEIIESDETKSYKNKRMIKSRLKRDFERVKFEIEAGKYQPLLSPKSNKDLYNELKSKFYRNVA